MPPLLGYTEDDSKNQAPYAPPPPPPSPTPEITTEGEDAFVSAASESIASQYVAPPAQPSFQGDPDYVSPTPGPSSSSAPSADTGVITPNLGVNYYDLPGQAPGVGVSYVDSNAPGYTSPYDDVQSLYQQFMQQNQGPAPTLGDGSGWFGTPDQQQQQYQWWQADVTKAVQSGDQATYDALMAELQRVRTQYANYYGYDTRPGTTVEGDRYIPGQADGYQRQTDELTRQFLDNLSASRQFDPSGEGGYVRLPSASALNGNTTGIAAGEFSEQPQYASRLYLEGLANQVTQAQGQRAYDLANAPGPSRVQGIPDSMLAMLAGSGQPAQPLYGPAVPPDVGAQLNYQAAAQQFGRPIPGYRGDNQAAGFVGGIESAIGSVANPITDALRATAGAVLNAPLPTNAVPGLPDLTLGQAAGGALMQPSQRINQAFFYGSSLTGQALEQAGKGLHAIGQLYDEVATPGGLTGAGSLTDPMAQRTAPDLSKVTAQDIGSTLQTAWLTARQQYDDQPALSRMAGEALLDPWNLVPLHEVVPALKGVAAAKYIGDLSPVFDPAEVDAVKAWARKDMTLRDSVQIMRGANKTGGLLPDNALGEAIAKRVSFAQKMAAANGTDLNVVRQAVYDDVDNIAQRLKASGVQVSDEDVVAVKRKLGQPTTQRAIASALTSEITPFPDPGITPFPPATPEARVAERDGQVAQIADSLPERPQFAVSHGNPVGVEDIYTGPIPASAPVTERQKGILRDLYGQGYINRQEAERIASGEASRDEAATLIEQRLAARDMTSNPTELATLGYPVDPLSAAGDTPEWEAAVREQAAREGMLANLWGDERMLPLANVATTAGYRRDAEVVNGVRRATTIAGTALPTLRPVEVWNIASNIDPATLTSQRLKDALADIVKYGTYVTKSGEFSSTTAREEFWRALGDLRAAYRDPSVPLSDLRKVYDPVLNHFLGTADAQAQAEQRAARLWGGLDEGKRTAQTAKIEAQKAKNLDLKQQIDALATDRRANGPQIRTLQNQLDQGVAAVKQWEPGYAVALPKVTPVEEVAQKQAALAQAVEADYAAANPPMPDGTPNPAAPPMPDVPQPSDPTAGFAPDRQQVADDATLDILTRPAQQQPLNITVEPGKPRANRVRRTPTNTPANAQKAAAKHAAAVARAEEWAAQHPQDAERYSRLFDDYGSGRITGLSAKRIRSLQDEGISIEALSEVLRRRLPAAGDIAADGGGAGFSLLHPVDSFVRSLPPEQQAAFDSARYLKDKVLAFRATYRPHIDPALAAYADFDWTKPELANAYDAWAKAHYTVDESFGRGAHGLFELQKGAKVAQFGDQVHMTAAQIADEIYANPELYPDPRAALADWLRTLADPKHDPSEYGHFFTHTKAGQQQLRNFRAHFSDDIAQKLLRGDYDHQQGLGRLFGDLIPYTKDGTLGRVQMQDIDALIMRGGRSRNPQVRQMSDMLKTAWKDGVRTRFFDPDQNAWLTDGSRVSLDALNRLIFPDYGQGPTDVLAIAHNLSTDLATAMAKSLGYDPDKVSADMRLMAAIKGNMAPLWMTMNPGYHLRNVMGNISAALLASARSDMHGGVIENRAFARATGETGSTVVWNPWAKTGIVHQAGSDFATESRHFVPRVIDKIPGLGQAKRGLERFGDAAEMYAKSSMYSNEWIHTYTTTWQRRVESLGVPPEVKQQLLGAVGMNQAIVAVEGQAPELRQLAMAYQREAVATANVKAYDTTAKALRDYRMRTRADGMLDRVFPIHYWTTRNMLFVGSTIANRPVQALHAFAGMKAWEQANSNLPWSQRAGLVHLPSAVTEPLGLGSDVYLNMTSMLNPAFFAIPKLLNAAAFDLSSGSLPHRIEALATDGPKALYESMGYNIGPQWDIAIKAADAAATQFGLSDKTLLGKLATEALNTGNYLTSPRGFMPGVIPYQSVITSIKGGKVAGVDISPEKAQEWLYTQIYGTPYMQSDYRKFALRAADMVQQGQLSDGQYQIIKAAMADGKFDYDPDYAQRMFDVHGKEQGLTLAETQAALQQLRPIVDATLGQSAAGWAKSAFIGLNLRNLSPQAASHKTAQDTYNQINKWAKSDVDVLKQGLVADATYRDMLNTYGVLDANAWMYKNAPWLPAYWDANDTPAEMRANVTAADMRAVDRSYYDAMDAQRELKTQQRITTNPYYARLDNLKVALGKALNRAGDSSVLKLKAYEVYKNGSAEVYADADAAGVTMVKPELFPSLPTYSQDYNLTPAQRDLAQRNDALDEVNGRALQQEQRAHILDLVSEHLGVNLYQVVPDANGQPQRVLNPAYQLLDKDGKPIPNAPDWDKYLAAVKDVSAEAPQQYQQILNGFIRGGLDVHLSNIVDGITPEDFIFHNRDADAQYHALKQAEQDQKSAYYDMPSGPEKDAARQALLDTYGPHVFDRTYDAGGGFTADQNRTYNEGGQQLASLYYANMTPTDQQAFRKAHPEAFVTADDGKVSFKWQNLSGDVIASTLTSMGYNADGSVSGREGIGAPTPGDMYGGTQEVAQLKDLGDQFRAVVPDGMTKEDADQAKAAYYAVLDHGDQTTITYNGQQMTLEQAAESVKSQYTNRAGQSTWTKAMYSAPAGPIKDYITQRVQAQQAMSPIWDAQDAWFNAQSPATQALLVQEGGSTFAKYAGLDSAGGASAGTGTDASGAAAGSSLPAVAGGGGSGGSSAPYASGGGSTGGSAGRVGSSTTAASATAAGPNITKQLVALDPWFQTNKDDGRGAIIQQVGNYYNRWFSLMAGIPNMSKWLTPYMAAVAASVAQKVGPTPTIADWQALLDSLLNPQSATPGPANQPAPFEPQQIVPQSFQTPYGY